MEKKTKNARKHIRHLPSEKEAIALLDHNPEHNRETFIHEFTGLIFSESQGGVGIVLRKSDSFQVGDLFLTKIGCIYPIRPEVVWRADNDPHILKIGAKFLD